LSGRGLCDELITRPEESYRLWCVVVCDLETSRTGAPYIYIYDISSLRVKERRQPPITQQSDLYHRMLHPDTIHISFPYQPRASMWVVALHYLLCNRTHPYPVTLLSTGSGHFWAKPFPCEYPHVS